MNNGRPFLGNLFVEGLLSESIVEFPEWQEIDEEELQRICSALLAVFARFPIGHSPNESQTEDDLIWPVLEVIGWKERLRQQNLSPRGREDVPDGLLFADRKARDLANGFADEWQRYRHGLAIVESKRWMRPLDRRSGHRNEESTPSTQMLRYLRRVDSMTTGELRWGILTNGARWRLYYSGARSVSEQFFELDLASILNATANRDRSVDISDEERQHWLKVFVLFFRREAFLPAAEDARTFHQRAMDEGRFFQEKVAASLSSVVFERVFPNLVRAIAKAAPSADTTETRDAALILLYRLLFIFYAEDRDLLPVREPRYNDYALRERVRADVGRRKDTSDTFSDTAARYWSIIDDLCRAIDTGDTSIGLPPYNGGLFDQERTPLLGRIRLGDTVMADAIDALSFEQRPLGRHYINYRDLGVQQLGSIYERLLEMEVTCDGNELVIRPNIFARKDSGSYYTPDELVGLILSESLESLKEARMGAFLAEASRLAESPLPVDRKLGRLKRLDPAEKLLELKVCDPSMGSGHFLVNLVDHLADCVIDAMAEAEATWDGYVSPLTERIDVIRNTIIANAEDRDWTVDPAQLDDRHIIRRMVLKRCVYGVDKNPMAVELAKVSLWLHTFTVGAPLSFLDHHLRCGDSLIGAQVHDALEKVKQWVGPVFLEGPLRRAMRAAAPMQIIEGLTDAEIAEAHRSAEVFAEVSEMTAPLNSFLALLLAFDWMGAFTRKDDASAIRSWVEGLFGDPVDIATERAEVQSRKQIGTVAERFISLLERARQLISEERFLNWQVAFPGVWSDWDLPGFTGGFDAVIGNPPWDRMKLQQVEWFAVRRREIAQEPRAADRKRMIAALRRSGDPLSNDYAVASDQVESALRMVRSSGEYPLLSKGDVNLYSLFVERSMKLVKPEGMVGLLVPSGIASDKMAARFFKSLSTQGRLKALYDFENRRPRYAMPPFFPDVHKSFKFCVFVASPSPTPDDAKCAFFLQSVSELSDADRHFTLSAENFARVNPNTGTAPVFRSRRDAELTAAIYSHVPVLVDRSSGEEVKSWPLKYSTMFHMTNDSRLFRRIGELEEGEGAWPIGGNRFDSPTGEWVPLYEGKMVQAFDHRAASIVLNPKNLHRPAQRRPATLEQHQNPRWVPNPQYWVSASECAWSRQIRWVLGYKEITAPTNKRTMIAALLPAVGFGNKIPLLVPETRNGSEWLLAANLNSTVLDFVARQKVHGQTINLFILEQLPVVPPDRYRDYRFGPKSAADIVREVVLELTYTSHDMESFARDLGYVDEAGRVPPPFCWDDVRRLYLRAKLDAVYFHLYGVTSRDDIRYVYSTFPNVQKEEERTWDRFLTRDLCLAWINALAAGNPDAAVSL